MADLSYVRGRLEGLYEMVTLLRDIVNGEVESSPGMLQKMVEHVYVELAEILDVVGSDVGKEGSSPIAQKIAEAKKSSKGGVKAKDVLSELLTKDEENTE